MQCPPFTPKLGQAQESKPLTQNILPQISSKDVLTILAKISFIVGSALGAVGVETSIFLTLVN